MPPHEPYQPKRQALSRLFAAIAELLRTDADGDIDQPLRTMPGTDKPDPATDDRIEPYFVHPASD